MKDTTSKARAANLKEKNHLRNLELSWNWEGNDGTNVCHVENFLEGLQPHHTLKTLHVEGYRGVRFLSWLPSLTCLVKLRISESSANIYHHCINSRLSDLYIFGI
jgi:hypothetical protein